VPSERIPALDRPWLGATAISPSRMKIPLGRPVFSSKRSPLTPAVATSGASLRCIRVRVSRPSTVSLDSTGASVVAVTPSGRGPTSTLSATGPLGVNWTLASWVTPGQRVVR
jgi:hypothetical protein